MALHANIPPAPALPNDAMTHVLVHHSTPGSDKNHLVRIAGQAMLRAAYMDALFRTRRDLQGTTLEVSVQY